MRSVDQTEKLHVYNVLIMDLLQPRVLTMNLPDVPMM